MFAGLAILLEGLVGWFFSSSIQVVIKKLAAMAVLTLLFNAVQQHVITPIIWPNLPPMAQTLGYTFGFDVNFPVVMAYMSNRFVIRAWMRALTS